MNEYQRFKIQAAEKSDLKGGCGKNRMCGESIENVRGIFGMACMGAEIKNGMVEVMVWPFGKNR